MISVILPAYNSEMYLKEAIESVLIQKHRPLEILLIDDGSIDNTAIIARAFTEIRYIYQKNSGPAAARNRGLQEAKGEFIAFIDADDIWPKNKLDLQLSYLLSNPATDVVMGHIQCLRLNENSAGAFADYGEPLTYYLLGSALFRKRVFERIGGFDESFPTAAGEDIDLFLHVRDIGSKMDTIEQITLFYRLHSGSTTCSMNYETRMRHFFKALKKSIDRRK